MRIGNHLKNKINIKGKSDIIFELYLKRKIIKPIKQIKIKNFKYFLNLYCDRCMKLTKIASKRVITRILNIKKKNI